MVEARGLRRNRNEDNPGTGRCQSEDNVPQCVSTDLEAAHRLGSTGIAPSESNCTA